MKSSIKNALGALVLTVSAVGIGIAIGKQIPTLQAASPICIWPSSTDQYYIIIAYDLCTQQKGQKMDIYIFAGVPF